ncbi:hypothetical protein ROZALSC1DRAFT_29558 [Rozella allomycis CSF55]|uniref:Uncharacterized protein n=1 Tax=Rozella allomycis (strain CSF55) TaxID=988480 RepID=A0A075AVM8_ROZAC|nr:hypothetical protein O9G_004067 [Rozella allomycis CSF55]RKP18798.1 hypothetical protein ROZALSC1DRAFT_29558 [Rozella allomycis CSF55]|eukprot:EPZ34190.1 hypothetical protein O9G_004067 [Rozella allomycis CSF55]
MSRSSTAREKTYMLDKIKEIEKMEQREQKEKLEERHKRYNDEKQMIRNALNSRKQIKPLENNKKDSDDRWKGLYRDFRIRSAPPQITSNESDMNDPNTEHGGRKARNGARIKVVKSAHVEKSQSYKINSSISEESDTFLSHDNKERSYLSLYFEELMLKAQEQVNQEEQKLRPPCYYKVYSPRSTKVEWDQPEAMDGSTDKMIEEVHLPSMPPSIMFSSEQFILEPPKQDPEATIYFQTTTNEKQATKPGEADDGDSDKGSATSFEASQHHFATTRAVSAISSTGQGKQATFMNTDNIDVFLFVEHLCHQSDLSVPEIMSTVNRFQYQKQLEQYSKKLKQTEPESREWMKSMWNESSASHSESKWLVNAKSPGLNSISSKRIGSSIGSLSRRSSRGIKGVKRNPIWLEQEKALLEEIRLLDEMIIDRNSQSFGSSTDSMYSMENRRMLLRAAI